MLFYLEQKINILHKQPLSGLCKFTIYPRCKPVAFPIWLCYTPKVAKYGFMPQGENNEGTDLNGQSTAAGQHRAAV